MEYHRLRAAAELARAEEAADAKTAALHRELAELHLISADPDYWPLAGEAAEPGDQAIAKA